MRNESKSSSVQAFTITLAVQKSLGNSTLCKNHNKLRHIFSIVGCVSLMTFLCFRWAYADYDDGMAAYQNRNYMDAFFEFSELAEEGMADAQFNIGFMYANGYGVEKDYSKAVFWYHKAAEQGMASAQAALGEMFYRGRGISKDYVQAAKLSQQAAKQGDAHGQFLLAVMYLNGVGVEKDNAEGVKWLQKAVDQGHEEAKLTMTVLSGKSPPIHSGGNDSKTPVTLEEILDSVGEMVHITGGSFMMGSVSDEGWGNQQPQHRVSVASFFIGKYEVTFDQYDLFARDTGRDFPEDKGWGRGNRPVIKVSWEDAGAYAKWLSEKTGEKYRLPTEAEWEYAARAGTATKFYWGDEVVAGRANCNGCGSRWDGSKTAPVGSFNANSFGLHDMAGNVWEWMQDTIHDSYEGAPADGSAWIDGDGDKYKRVLRGGSWNDKPSKVGSAYRTAYFGISRISRENGIGFRLVRSE